MPKRGIRRIVEMVLDKTSAGKVKRQMKEVLDDGTDFSGAEQRAGGFFGKMRGWVKALGLAIAAIGVQQAVRAFDRLITRGGQVLNVQRAFARATGDQETAIRQLRSAANGLISDYDLMVQANQALTLGSAENVEQVAELVDVSQQLGRALGIDATFALNSLNIGIARQSRLYLDNLGIIIDVDEANRAYAATLGKTVDQLTELERREAFRVAALEGANEAVERLGGFTGQAADAWERLNIQRRNWMDAIGRTIAQSERLAEVFQAIADRFEARSLEASFGSLESVQAQIEQVDRLLENMEGRTLTAGESRTRSRLREAREELETYLTILQRVDRQTRDLPLTEHGFELDDMIREQERYIATLEEGTEAQRLAQFRLEALLEVRERMSRQFEKQNEDAEEGAQANQEVAETLSELHAQLRLVDDLHAIYGDRIDVVKEKTSAYESAIRSLLENGLRPTSAQVRRLVDEMEGLESALLSQQIEAPSLEGRGLPLPGVQPDPNLQATPLSRPFDPEQFERARLEFLRGMDSMRFAAMSTGQGIASAFEDAFTMMLTGFSNVENAALAVAGSMAAALLEGVAEFARGKVAENIAAGFEALARASAFAAHGNFASAAAMKASAAHHFTSAAKWAVAAGAAGALGGAVGGAGRGGGAGRTNTGDGPATRVNFRGERQGTEVHIYIDPFDPDSPLHQRQVGRAAGLARERFGDQVPVKVHHGRRNA